MKPGRCAAQPMGTLLLLCLVLVSPVRAETIEAALNAFSQGDYTNALDILERLAKDGHARAQYNLGAMYDSGSGVEEDDQVAAHWYLAAAQQGMANAAFNLGNLYREGHGLAKSYVDAVYWYRKAADQGDTKAQYNLGAMYENGFGVEADLEQAMTWYEQAAQQGQVHAQYRIGTLSLSSEELAADRIKALRWFRQAAQQGYSPAQYDLTALEAEIVDIRREIKGSIVNLREQPGTSANVLGRLPRGQEVFTRSTDGEWVEVVLVDRNLLSGWVHGSLLR